MKKLKIRGIILRKFFVENKNILLSENKIIIDGEDVNHIKNVLRLEIGTSIKICDKENVINYISKISKINNDNIECEIIEEVSSDTEKNVELHIYQGLPKADKMELIIQKGTELGISKFIPVKLSRCIVKLDGKDEIKKIDRWQKISEAAAKQSGRDLVPEITNLKSIKEVSNLINEYDLFLVAFEEEKENTIKNELLKIKDTLDNYKVAVLVGPEGGLQKDEVDFLEESGAKVITLGSRILRTETVAMYIASVIMYELEMK